MSLTNNKIVVLLVASFLLLAIISLPPIIAASPLRKNPVLRLETCSEEPRPIEGFWEAISPTNDNQIATWQGIHFGGPLTRLSIGEVESRICSTQVNPKWHINASSFKTNCPAGVEGCTFLHLAMTEPVYNSFVSRPNKEENFLSFLFNVNSGRGSSPKWCLTIYSKNKEKKAFEIVETLSDDDSKIAACQTNFKKETQDYLSSRRNMKKNKTAGKQKEKKKNNRVIEEEEEEEILVEDE